MQLRKIVAILSSAYSQNVNFELLCVFWRLVRQIGGKKMQARTACIETDPARSDCFAAVSENFVETVLVPAFNGSLPFVAALELIANSNGETTTKHYVACLPHQPHKKGNSCVMLSQVFCSALNLHVGDAVTLRPLPHVPVASSVVVEPASVDDSEIVEHNQRLIENSLLRLLRVVYPGMIAVVQVHQGVSVRLRFGKIVPERQVCAVLSDGTELYVATQARKSTQDAESAPLDGVVRVLPRSACSVSCRTQRSADGLPSLIVSEATASSFRWKDGLCVGVISLVTAADEMESMRTAQKDAKPPPGQHPTDPFSIEAANMLRKGTRAVVRMGIISCEEPSSSQQPIAVLDGADLGSNATACWVMPQPPAQVADKPSSSTLSHSNVGQWTLDQLRSVHGDVVSELSSSLRACFRHPVHGMPFHILLCGSRGSGKTTVATLCAESLGDCHVKRVQCTPKCINDIRLGFFESMAAAPSVLILDDLDLFLPADVEGQRDAQGVAAYCSAMRDLLQAVYQPVSFMQSSGHNTVVVIATTKERESLNKSLTQCADCFACVLKLHALTVASRSCLIEQMIGQVGRIAAADANSAAAKMDNFTPHDIHRVCLRAVVNANPTDSDKTVTLADIQKALEGYSPLAHNGVRFLRQRETTTMDCVGGMKEAKKVLHDALVLPSKYPQLFAKLPLKTRSGVLLYGPPGCGKSYIMSSLVAAHELNCIVVNGPEILDKYIGASEQKVRDVFERAQAASPCVLFFDEFDSIAPQRGHDNTGVTDRVVNQLLCYLDGVESRSKVFVVAASSRPDLIDAALLRPGRLDKSVLCPIPTKEDRVEVLRAHLSKLPHASPNIDVQEVSSWCDGWTCADLAALVSTTSMKVLQRTIDLKKHLAAMNVASSPTVASPTAEMEGDGEVDVRFTVVAPSRKVRQDIQQELMKNEAAQAALGISAAQPSHQAKPSDAPTVSLTMDDLREAFRLTRPSITPKDRMRYEATIKKFTNKRGAQDVVEQRTTMA